MVALTDLEYVLKSMTAALQQLTERDQGLFEQDVSEPSITHKLAEYLQPFFQDFHVDCEYNRNGQRPKRLAAERGLGRESRPDIIIHRRRSNDHNLVIVEAKKSNDRRKNGEARDRRKVEAFVDDPPYLYQVGLFVEFNVDSPDKPPYRLSCYCKGMWSDIV